MRVPFASVWCGGSSLESPDAAARLELGTRIRARRRRRILARWRSRSSCAPMLTSEIPAEVDRQAVRRDLTLGETGDHRVHAPARAELRGQVEAEDLVAASTR